MTSTRYYCPSAVSAHCQTGNTAPKSLKCSRCGSVLIVKQGTWGVFEWTGTGHYPLHDAKRAFSRYSSAVKHADSSSGLVVRFVTEGAESA